VDTEGQLTALKPGAAIITVTTVDGLKTAACTVTVLAAEPETTAVTGVVLNQATLSLVIGKSAGSLIATVAPANATNQAVSWHSDNEAVAVVDSEGKVSPIGEGSAIITVTTEDGGYTASCTVTVSKDEGSPGTDPGTDPGTNPESGTGSDFLWPSVQPQETVPAGTWVVKAELLQSSGSDGIVKLELPKDATTVLLPAGAGDLLGSKGLEGLEVHADKLVLTLPAALLQQLSSQLGTGGQSEGQLEVKLLPIAAAVAEELLAKGAKASGTAIKSVSDLYEVRLGVKTADGRTVELAQFDKPATLRLKTNVSADPGLTGIYLLKAGEKPRYVGGIATGSAAFPAASQAVSEAAAEAGWLSAVIERSGSYGVLEVSKLFSDLENEHWAYKVIAELAAKQIIEGVSETTFEPGRSVTRAEYAAMLVRVLGLTKAGEKTFGDVSAEKWYAEAVAIAYEAGIVTGRSEQVFDPEGVITREELVVMTMKGYELVKGRSQSASPADSANSANSPENAVRGLTPFKDEEFIASWALSYVQRAAELQLIQGLPGGKFAPKSTASRAEAAKIIYGLLH